MRRAGLVALVMLAAGCTSFAENTRILSEIQTGPLRAGEGVSRDFELAAPASFLLVGFRTGPATGVQAVLRSPAGTLFATETASGEPCAVRQPALGMWQLQVAADAGNGSLAGGAFTVRAGVGDLPALYACSDEVFPVVGYNVTLAARHIEFVTGGTFAFDFEQPYNLTNLTASFRPSAPNATSDLYPAAASSPSTVPRGAWRVRVEAVGEVNATLLVVGHR